VAYLLIYEIGEDDRVKQISVVLHIEGAEMTDHSWGRYKFSRKGAKSAKARLGVFLCVFA
jgi:hypothetical protein